MRWELEPTPSGTLVGLHHSGFAGAPAQAQDHYQGWQRVVGWMQEFVEKGITVADRPAPKQLGETMRYHLAIQVGGLLFCLGLAWAGEQCEVQEKHATGRAITLEAPIKASP